MSTSREKILNKLRSARRPFPDAPPRPAEYAPVTGLDAAAPNALLERFTEVAESQFIKVIPVEGDEATLETITGILRDKGVTHLLAWHFTQIPVKGLKGALKDAGVKVTHPDVQDEFRAETVELIRDAGAGLTGVDAIAATTATLVVSTGKGRGRIPSLLPEIHIAVATLDQLVGRIEDWVALMREEELATISDSAEIAFISAPSMTADIEKIMVLGVHGPRELVVVVKTGGT